MYQILWTPRPRAVTPGSSVGGRRTAERMTPAQRSARGQSGGNAVRDRYGLGYYSALARSGRRKQEELQAQ